MTDRCLTVLRTCQHVSAAQLRSLLPGKCQVLREGRKSGESHKIRPSADHFYLDMRSLRRSYSHLSAEFSVGKCRLHCQSSSTHVLRICGQRDLLWPVRSPVPWVMA